MAADDERLGRRVARLCREWVDGNAERGVVVHVTRRGRPVVEAAFGRTRPLAHGAAVRPALPDDIYLVASLTKPLTALAVCLLVERGQVLLDDYVGTYLPAFAGGERAGVCLRHLLTHTSGLPDMLPDNTALRSRHAPLSEFIAGACTTPLLFKPGTDCRYQSMGTLLAAAVVEQVSGMTLPRFLQGEVFAPLGMQDTCLGLGDLDDRRVVNVVLSEDDAATSWNWNSAYWRSLGAPWGGLHTTARDYTRLLLAMLGGGLLDGRRLAGAATVRAMLRNQLESLPGLPQSVRTEQAWGLGWRLNHPAGAHGLPELAAASVFGHAGATGTVAWADPDRWVSCVVLTNDPSSLALRARLSNVVAAAID